MANKDNMIENVTQGEQSETVEKKTSPFNKDELMRIFDTIVFEGAYSEEVVIKGKLKVVFKSRTAGEVSSISTDLDSKMYNLLTTIQEQRALLNLCYGILRYGNKDLSNVPIDQKKNFILALPASMIGSLSEAQNKFDQKVDAACQEGEENF
jgi:hypothetical protein